MTVIALYQKKAMQPVYFIKVNNGYTRNNQIKYVFFLHVLYDICK